MGMRPSRKAGSYSAHSTRHTLSERVAGLTHALNQATPKHSDSLPHATPARVTRACSFMTVNGTYQRRRDTVYRRTLVRLKIEIVADDE